MASKRAIYKALTDLTNTLIEGMVDNELTTVWCTNELTLVPEGKHGLFAFITYNGLVATAVHRALEQAGLLPRKDLGELGEPPPAEHAYQEPVVTQADREAAVTALREDSEVVRVWIRTGVRKGLFNEDLERVAYAVSVARMEGKRGRG